jgi:hypothetical protein
MRNSVPLPAHLSSSSDAPFDSSGLLDSKYLQSPERAPKWWHALVSIDWLECAYCRDQQAMGLMPSSTLGGTPLSKSQRCEEAKYQLWKHTLDALWEEECTCHQAAACQCLLDERAAHNCQEVAHRQQLLDKRTAQTSVPVWCKPIWDKMLHHLTPP